MTERPGSEATAVPASEDPDAPREVVLRVVFGSPTVQELAALVAVLAALPAASGGDPVDDAAPTSTWAAPAARLRTAYGHGRAGWRASALPR